MLKSFVIEARTIEDAEKQAMDLLKLPLEKITLNVLKEKKSLLGLKTVTTYEALPNINLALEGKRFLEGIFNGLCIEIKMEMRSKDDGENIKYDIYSNENALLIGSEGKTLRSIQMLLREYLIKFTNKHIVINLDIGNYNQNRKKQLEILATKTAKDVARTKIEAVLEPMNSFERRIIHTKLSEWRDVKTESVGEGENRQIVIKPA